MVRDRSVLPEKLLLLSPSGMSNLSLREKRFHQIFLQKSGRDSQIDYQIFSREEINIIILNLLIHSLPGGTGLNLRLWPFQNGMFNITEIGKN